MSGNLAGFNANEVQPNEGFSAVPAGDYQVIILKSELKKTKAGTGTGFNIEMQILNGPHQNRKLFTWINWTNPNPKAQQIGRGDVSAICRAVDTPNPNDFSELHNKPLTAVVKCKRDGDGNITNEVKGFKPRNAQPNQQQPAQTATAAPQVSPFPAAVQTESNDGVPF